MSEQDHSCKLSGSEQVQSRSLIDRQAQTLQRSASHFPFSPGWLRNRTGTSGQLHSGSAQGLAGSTRRGQGRAGGAGGGAVVPCGCVWGVLGWAPLPIRKVSPLRSSERRALSAEGCCAPAKWQSWEHPHSLCSPAPLQLCPLATGGSGCSF